MRSKGERPANAGNHAGKEVRTLNRCDRGKSLALKRGARGMSRIHELPKGKALGVLRPHILNA